MNYVEINGKVYDVIVTQIQRTGQIKQSENAGVTLAEGAEERLDPLGTFIQYAVTFKRRNNAAMFDELWNEVTKPRYSGVPVKIVYNQTTLEFKARFSVASQNVERIDRRNNKVYWGDMVVTIIPTKAQVLPL